MIHPAGLAIVGAGWSGLACAVELVDRGAIDPARITLLDAAPATGGRGRTVRLRLHGQERAVDNGQHLLLGACTAVLRAMRIVGADPATLLERRPFEMAYADGWRLAAARAPHPLHLALGLARATGMGTGARIALARWALARHRQGWTCPASTPVSALLAPLPPDLVRRLWRPLCLAVMNAEPEQSDGRIFLQVLRDSLAAGRSASDFLLPRVPLSDLFPAPALRWLQARGVQSRSGAWVQALERSRQGGWQLRLRDDEAGLHCERVVLALPPERAATLLRSALVPQEHAPSPAAQDAIALAAKQLERIAPAPIATAYLAYERDLRLAAPVLALQDEPSRQRFGQWVFDRGATDPALRGVLSVVVSGTGAHMELEHGALGAAIGRQLQDALGLGPPADVRVLAERHATLLPVPGLERPPARLAADLALAGDSADSPYPSTLEGSVRAGLAAAQILAS